jgi:leucyl-tRNA synthetase
MQTEAEQSLLQVMHRSIKGVTLDTERFHFNTAISRIMELVNELYHYTGDRAREEYNCALLKKVTQNLIILLSPFAPHLSEELWEKVGGKPSVFDQKWPAYDEKYLEQDEIDWVIQINGKIRERVKGPIDLSGKAAEKFGLEAGRIPQLIEGKQLRKIIVVPKKLINIVVS